jgi:monovalent cation/hydrogen antiporter
VLDPHVVLTFIIPPLLYSTALNSSLIAIRGSLRSVISLSVVLVLITALLVGVGIDLFIPGATLAAGVALGAAVAPPDPVAALAIGRRVGLPARLITLIEGEGLLNDATALTTFLVAVDAVKGGNFSFGRAALTLVLVSIGGVAVGGLVAVVVRLIRAVVDDPIALNALSLGTPFAAYLFGEEIHVSGVLAVVVAGLIIGHDTPRAVSGASRLQTAAVWRLVDFLLEGFVFLLIGQQLPKVLRGLKAYPISTIAIAAAITVGVAIAIRPIWLLLTQSLPRRLGTHLGDRSRADDRLPGREVVALSWAGTRGVISLAAVFSLPLVLNDGAPFAARDLLIFCTYLVVLVTLIGQGVTFGPVVSILGLHADLTDQIRVRSEARLASLQAGLDCLDELVAERRPGSSVGADPDEGGEVAPDADAVAAVRARLTGQLARAQRRIAASDAADDSDGGAPVAAPADLAIAAMRRAVIDAQRDELLRWRDSGRLPDASLRILQRELDHDEHALPGMNPT